MIVDCHTHINCGENEAGAVEYSTVCKDVDFCIVLSISAGSQKQSNKDVSEYVNKHKDKAIGFAAVNPLIDNISSKYLKALKNDMGLKGLVLYCAGDGFHPAHTRAMRLYESALEMDMPVFFHNSSHLSSSAVLSYAQPYLLDEIAITFPELKIIIGGMGRPFSDQTFCLLDKHKNVYADLTIDPLKVWRVYNLVVTAHETDVMDKLLFGSGFPYGRPVACMETLLGFNKLLANTNLLPVPREKIRNIIDRDTFKLLGIEI